MAKMDSTDAAVDVGSGLQATSPHEQYVGDWPVLFHVIFFSIDLLREAVRLRAEPAYGFCLGN